MIFRFAACTAPAPPETAETQIPIVVADQTIIAEGRLERIHFAEIAFTASGVISDVLVTEGPHVRKGETLIRLGNENATNYAAAQLELANAQQAWDDLILARDEKLAESVIALKDAKEKYVKGGKLFEVFTDFTKDPSNDNPVDPGANMEGIQV